MRLILALTAFAAPLMAQEAQQFEATLAGHAILPAETFVLPPEVLWRTFGISGRFTSGERVDVPFTVPGISSSGPREARRSTSLSLPFVGQPVQGFSGVKAIGDGRYWSLSDNGFGSRLNSPDALLMAHIIAPDWQSGEVLVERTVFLSDPGRLLPFKLVNEFTTERYLTGADFDLESLQPVGDLLWFGEEFGPYLFATDLEGRVVFFTDVIADGEVVQSPDHPDQRLPSSPDRELDFTARRSRGLEGMAQSPDGTTLYPLLEGPLWDAEAAAFETGPDGRTVTRLLEFDVDNREYTGRHWFYPLEADSHAIGDFNMIDGTRGLVIERDGGEGSMALACPEGAATTDCFARPAEFKRVYLISLDVEPGQQVEKRAYIDLLDIADPDGMARQGGANGRFDFPFVTIENVDRVSETEIIVGNDNNLPFSAGRALDRADDNEWILLEVGDFLQQ